MSAITVAELRFGTEKSRKAKATRDKLMRAIDTLHMAPFEAGAAAQYGVVRAALEQAGTPIGPVDTLIAGHALSLHLTLVTGNVRGFSRVDGLRVENWVPQ